MISNAIEKNGEAVVAEELPVPPAQQEAENDSRDQGDVGALTRNW